VVTRGALLALAAAVVLATLAHGESLRILYTNDLHLRFERLPALEHLIAAERAQGDPVLLVDAGDAWQDFRVPLYAVWGAESMVTWMNRVGYDAMAVGNHDLYWNWPRVAQLVGKAKFLVLSANLASIDGEEPPFVASVRVKVGGLDVLILGLTTAEDLPYLDFSWLRPTDPVRAAQREIDAASESGRPDLVLCVGHVGLDEAARIAAAVPTIDIFVSGHSHEATPAPRVVGKTLIVESGAFGRSLGRLVLDVGEGSVRLVEHSLLATEKAVTDIGHGLMRLTQIVGILALLLAVLLF
jgi:2',3'-cyclic-nucleotide 2'-phosphodiesterase (5'-nucleotidase family)